MIGNITLKKISLRKISLQSSYGKEKLENIYTAVGIEKLQLCVLSPQVDITYIEHVCGNAAPSSFYLGNTSKIYGRTTIYSYVMCELACSSCTSARFQIFDVIRKRKIKRCSWNFSRFINYFSLQIDQQILAFRTKKRLNNVSFYNVNH